MSSVQSPPDDVSLNSNSSSNSISKPVTQEREPYTKAPTRGLRAAHGQHDPHQPNRYQSSKAWWSVGEFRHQGITHQSVGLSLGQNEDDFWDLSDSLVDLYQHVTQRQKKAASKVRTHNRSGSTGAMAGIDNETQVDIKRWLDEDSSHGFIRVFASDADTGSRLFPCNLSTMAQKICLQLGIPGNSLHVQLSGHVIKRMEPFDCPLAIQNEYLAGLGYSDKRYIQEEGPKEDLSYLVRFYAGKPLSDYTYARNQLTTFAYVRKGKLRHQWVRRRCVISGTRLMIYRENEVEPTTVQLAKGSVEEIQVKGQSLVIKLTSTLQGERSIFISFNTQEDYSKWLKKFKKATAKLPSKADLSNCHLEFLPETVFINTDLQVLILRHNALRERPFDEDIYTIGWLDDLPRFNTLRCLNLADNQLSSFPMALCEMHSLMELNLASNKLTEVPSQISVLKNLQVLHLHNNMLSSLPEEIAHMHKLAVVVLAFNRFVHIPSVLLQSLHASFKLDSIIMAGNQISRLPVDQLVYMGHIKKIDLRLNCLQLLPTETAKFQSLEHVTHLDIRENEVQDLDIRAIRCLEYINCDRNDMRSMQLNGASLKNVFASKNSLHTLSINPKPEWLVSMDVSHNKLTVLPDWLSDCFFLVRLDVSHNNLKALPDRLLCGAPKLKIIKANHNRLTVMPNQVISETLEELHLQHNLLRSLSPNLFIKAQRLRYLNVTRNKLNSLPATNQNDSFNKLQELYLSFNHLGNEVWHPICSFPRLRVLHVARNRLSVIAETDVEKLEQLTELNISSNNLTYLPSSLGRHPKLQILRASCNLLQELPNFKNSSALKVLEASSNHLVNVNMANLMASQVSLLDISANPNVMVKSHHRETAKNSKHLCLVDMWGQNRSLDDLSTSGQQRFDKLWQTGLTQTSGMRNKLCVAILSKPQFNDNGDALFGVFDGGRNDTVAGLLCDIMPTVLKEERLRNKSPHIYMKYTMLSAHRHLKSHGQKLGASSVLVYIHANEKGQHLLSIANVGDCQVVLCRHRKAMFLSRAFLAEEDREDTSRVIRAGGIITEDGRVSGVTYNTRLLGCSYLYPHVIPEPYVTSTLLTPEDTFFIVASHGLWEFVSHEEAIREVKDVPDPVIAAKRLQDLAQGYGSRENLAILVVRLTLTHTEQTRICEQVKSQKNSEKDLIKVLNQRTNLLHLRDGVPKDADVDGIIIDRSGHAKSRKHRSSRKHLLEPSSSDKGSLYSSHSSSTHSKGFVLPFTDRERDMSISNLEAISNDSDSNKYGEPAHSASHMAGISKGKQDEGHLYKKKNDMAAALRKRITDDLKTRELKNTFEIEMHEDTKNHSNEYDDDNDEDILVHDMEFNSNWTAVKVNKSRPDNSMEWESQLKQRLENELLDKELEAVKESDQQEDGTLPIPHDPQSNKSNWTTISIEQKSPDRKQISPRNISDPINKVQNISLPMPMQEDASMSLEEPDKVQQWISSTQSASEESLPGELIRMMQHSSHSEIPEMHQEKISGRESDFNRIKSIPEEDVANISPNESVSSIDVRLHDEAEDIYQLRHMTNIFINNSTVDESTDDYEDNDLGCINFSRSPNLPDGDQYRRPLSPDSIISLDDFVKPPIDNSNIDRDALLFHQMQMARAQAHSGSSASLDTVQSAPINPTMRDVVANVRASSHSIEVLVNIGLDQDKRPFDQGSLTEMGSTSTLKGSRTRMPSSLNDVTMPRVRRRDRGMRLSKEDVRLREGHHGKITTQANESTDHDPDTANGDDDYSDKDTLVGDASDIANLMDLTEEEVKGDTSSCRLLHVSYPHPGEDGDQEDASDDDDDNNNDQDSDNESIGNVSLEDGYDAFEFISSSAKHVSLSMTNVLENESDYMDIDFSNTNKAPMKGQTKATQINGALPPRESEINNNNSNDDHVKIDISNSDVKEEVDDYEDIDQNKEGCEKNEVDIDFIDDIDQYEVVVYKPRGEIKKGDTEEEFVNEPTKETNENVPTEEDIDALYAKVNKIKLKKLLADENGDEDNFMDFIPNFNPNNQKLNAPEISPFRINSRDSDDSTDDDFSDEEREIFITASDIPMTTNLKRTHSDTPLMGDFIDPSLLSQGVSVRVGNMPPSHTTTSATTEAQFSNTATDSLPDTQSKKPQRSSSFKPASHFTNMDKPHHKPKIPPKTFSDSYSSPPPPPLNVNHFAPKPSTHTVQLSPPPPPPRLSSSSSSSSSSPPPPPPRLSSPYHHPVVHITFPLKTSNVDCGDETQSYKPIPLPRSHVMNSQSRLSPHEPMTSSSHNDEQSGVTSSHHRQHSPTLSISSQSQPPLSSVAVTAAEFAKGHLKVGTIRTSNLPMDMQPAARQLPTQRSIIITYL